jgi:hypothetical protein
MANDMSYNSVYHKSAFGDFGLEIIASGETSTVGEQYNAIQALEDSTISATNNTTKGDTSISSLDLTTGIIIYGSFHTISVSAGKVIAYIE